MPYYTRVLSPNRPPVQPVILRAALAVDGIKAGLSGDDPNGRWEHLVCSLADGTEVCLIEYNEVADVGLGREEIDEFIDDLREGRPKSAAAWLVDYLAGVRSIYAIQILGASDANGGWRAIRSLQNALLNAVGGIIQADGEGFSNEDGYHILWQFSDAVTGDWWMAVLDRGRWVKFRMDLGNRDHRAAFLRGEVPVGVTPSSR